MSFELPFYMILLSFLMCRQHHHVSCITSTVTFYESTSLNSAYISSSSSLGDAEMENRMNRVIRACVELGRS